MGEIYISEYNKDELAVILDALESCSDEHIEYSLEISDKMINDVILYIDENVGDYELKQNVINKLEKEQQISA